MYGLAIAAFLAIGYWRYRVNKIPGHWTPERSAMYRAAMRYERNPAKLMELAQHFQQEGFVDKAFPLRTRAALVQMPQNVRMQLAGHGGGGHGGGSSYGHSHGGRMHGELGSAWASFGRLFGRERGAQQRGQLTQGQPRGGHHVTAETLMRRALSSGKPEVIHRVAAGFEKTGRGACADLLKSYARGLDAAGEVEDPTQSRWGADRFGASSFGFDIPSHYVPPSPSVFGAGHHGRGGHMGDTLRPGQILAPGQVMMSNQQSTKLRMNVDGSVDLLDPTKNDAPKWHITQGVSHQGVHLEMQRDGVLAVKDGGGNIIWSSADGNGGQAIPGSYLLVQDDGNLVVYDPQGNSHWASDTYKDFGRHPQPPPNAGGGPMPTGMPGGLVPPGGFVPSYPHVHSPYPHPHPGYMPGAAGWHADGGPMSGAQFGIGTVIPSQYHPDAPPPPPPPPPQAYDPNTDPNNGN
jgi:hypothetical protein